MLHLEGSYFGQNNGAHVILPLRRQLLTSQLSCCRCFPRRSLASATASISAVYQQCVVHQANAVLQSCCMRSVPGRHQLCHVFHQLCQVSHHVRIHLLYARQLKIHRIS